MCDTPHANRRTRDAVVAVDDDAVHGHVNTDALNDCHALHKISRYELDEHAHKQTEQDRQSKKGMPYTMKLPTAKGREETRSAHTPRDLHRPRNRTNTTHYTIQIGTTQSCTHCKGHRSNTQSSTVERFTLTVECMKAVFSCRTTAT